VHSPRKQSVAHVLERPSRDWTPSLARHRHVSGALTYDAVMRQSVSPRVRAVVVRATCVADFERPVINLSIRSTEGVFGGPSNALSAH
jgi:hypothetical protein